MGAAFKWGSMAWIPDLTVEKKNNDVDRLGGQSVTSL
jgi:hypothetical protein